jgi:hypothetical protein
MMRVQLSLLRTLAGVTAVVVPFAIAVHLVSEGIALGPSAISPDFWLRHAYLLVPLALALWSFSSTLGLGAPRPEMIRQCALVRARLRAAGSGSTIVTFTAANLAFFAVTQLLEGVPIASASIGTGLAAAVLGALISALVIFFFGRSLVATALAVAVRLARHPGRVALARRRISFVSRAAAATFSLLRPKRPPPVPSPA